MADPICTNFIDQYGLDLGSTLVSKKYMLENYQELLPQNKIPALWVWGSNGYGELGDNTITYRSSPIQTVSCGTNWKIISASNTYSVAIKTDGTLWNWGCNLRGQIGIGNPTTGIYCVLSPVQTSAGGSNWRTVATGGETLGTTVAIKTDGTLWNWGFDDILTRDICTPIQLFAGTNNWSKVSVGCRYALSIKTDGTLWGWGLNSSGQLGNGNTVSQNSPVQTALGGNDWKYINSALSDSKPKSYGIKNSGTLWAWGYNRVGDLGIGCSATVYISIPTQICIGSSDWKQVSSGYNHTLAVKTNGTLWGWGCNLCSAIPTNSSRPYQIMTGTTNWRQVSAGCSSSSAIKTDGTLWTWGNNLYGQAGTNTGATITSPVQTVAGGYNWKQVVSGTCHTMAIADLGGF